MISGAGDELLHLWHEVWINTYQGLWSHSWMVISGLEEVTVSWPGTLDGDSRRHWSCPSSFLVSTVGLWCRVSFSVYSLLTLYSPSFLWPIWPLNYHWIGLRHHGLRFCKLLHTHSHAHTVVSLWSPWVFVNPDKLKIKTKHHRRSENESVWNTEIFSWRKGYDSEMDQQGYFTKCLWNLIWDFTVEVIKTRKSRSFIA